jgi:hypothetical protein
VACPEIFKVGKAERCKQNTHAVKMVAFGVRLQDVDVVGDAVQQSTGDSLRAEDLSPLVE